MNASRRVSDRLSSTLLVTVVSATVAFAILFPQGAGASTHKQQTARGPHLVNIEMLPQDGARTNIYPLMHLKDGKLYRPGAMIMIYPGPAYAPVEVINTNIATTYRLTKALYDALRTPRGGWPTVQGGEHHLWQVTATVDGRTRVAKIPDLDLLLSSPTLNGSGTLLNREQRTARTKITTLLRSIESLTGPSTMLPPTRLEMWSAPAKIDSPIDVGVPESAPQPWPTGVREDLACVTVRPEQLPAEVNSATLFLTDQGVRSATFRVLYPGEAACKP